MDFKEAYNDTCSTVSKAARLGDVDALKQLIQSGKAIDVRDNRGWQSIHEAAYHGHVDCLDIIIIEGAEVDCRTFEEETALMLACKGGHLECVTCLLHADADPNSTTKEDFTPLWEAAVVNIECVKLLVDAGARVNHQIYTGDTALHEVVNRHKDSFIDVVKYLMDNGADLSIQNEPGLTPLFLAAQYGLTDCLQYFIDCAKKKGEDFKKEMINKTAYDNASPLYLAAQERHVNCVKILLENGADPNVNVFLTDNITIAPLQAALENGNVECVKLLIKVTDLEQFRIKSMLQWDHHPIAYAGELSSEECMKILLEQEFFKKYFKEKIKQYHNPFAFAMTIRPAIVLVKHFPLRLNDWFSSPSNVISFQSLCSDFSFLLLSLRLGARQTLFKFLVSKKASRLEYWCAMLKYLRRSCLCWDYEDDCASSIPCKNAACNPTWTRKSLPPVQQLQLYLSCPVVDKLQDSSCPWQLQETFENAYGSNIVDAREIRSLQNMCRQTVVLRLIYSNNYNKETIQRGLDLPKPLQQYLLYNDTDFGDQFLSACQYLVNEEIKLDHLLNDVTID